MIEVIPEVLLCFVQLVRIYAEWFLIAFCTMSQMRFSQSLSVVLRGGRSTVDMILSARQLPREVRLTSGGPVSSFHRFDKRNRHSK